jgi:hypothetical protein
MAICLFELNDPFMLLLPAPVAVGVATIIFPRESNCPEVPFGLVALCFWCVLLADA